MNTKTRLMPVLCSKLKAESEKQKAKETPDIYSLKKIKQEYVVVLLSILAILLQLLITIHAATAQEQQSAGLQIGDTVPNVTIIHLINYKTTTVKLSDFKDKLIILDFWATWCSACIKKLPEMDSLQKKFQGKLQIISVNCKSTGDSRDKIIQFLKKREKASGQASLLPVATGDTVLDHLFPHRLIPHYVWIGADGTVKAITSSGAVNAKNITTLLDHQPIAAAEKADIDTRKPLFSGEHLPEGQLLHYSILLKGRVEGTGSGTQFRKKDTLICGRVITNRDLLSLYKIVAHGLLPEFNDKRIILEIRDSSGLLFSKSGLTRAAWYRDNLYSYDLIVPPAEADDLYRYMLEDLNRYSPYHAEIEKRKVRCLVLLRTSREDRIRTRGGEPQNTLFYEENKSLRNTPFAHLVARLNSQDSPALPVIDETGYSGNIDITVSAAFTDVPALRKDLQRYGLDLREAERNASMLVIRDKQALTHTASTHSNSMF